MRELRALLARSTRTFGVAMLLVAPLQSAQQARRGGVIDGVVSDTSLAPIDRVTASLLATEVRVTTGTTGRFRITGIPAGRHILELRRLGYAPLVSMVTVTEGDTVRLSFIMEPLVTTLAPTVVTGERPSEKMREFDARRRAGFGRFSRRRKSAPETPPSRENSCTLFQRFKFAV
ncbi:MAG: carboxypeptidase regulatory-like domain-containing protein [bacterium]